MANALYPKTKKRFHMADLDMQALPVRAVLINVSGGGVTYTYSASHETMEDVPSDAVVAVSNPLTNVAFGDDGSFDSDDPVLIGVNGNSVEALLLVADTGTTAFLVMYQDSDITGLPLNPDGSDVQIIVDSGGWYIL